MSAEAQLDRVPVLPWYPETAADILRDPTIASWSAYEQLVYIRARWACWVHGSIPADPQTAALVLCMRPRAVRRGLTDRVRSRMVQCTDDDTRMMCPDMETLRGRQRERHEHLAASGREGARRRWRDGRANGLAIATPLATPIARASTSTSASMEVMHINKLPTGGRSYDGARIEGRETDDAALAEHAGWIADYEREDARRQVERAARAYRRASRG